MGMFFVCSVSLEVISCLVSGSQTGESSARYNDPRSLGENSKCRDGTGECDTHTYSHCYPGEIRGTGHAQEMKLGRS